MAKIPNIKVVIPDGDPSLAVVTDRDTGERIENLVALRIDLDANRNPFAVVEMKVECTVEYQGPVESEEEFIISVPEAYREMEIECGCDTEAIKRVFVEEIVPVLDREIQSQRAARANHDL